jgi:hypothetical protein
MAMETTRENRFSGQRYREFNIQSEQMGRGLEWRSPNMRGVNTWKEFAEYWEIVFECLEVLAKRTLNAEDYEEFIVEHEGKSLTINTTQNESIGYSQAIAEHIQVRSQKKTYSNMTITIPTIIPNKVTIDV